MNVKSLIPLIAAVLLGLIALVVAKKALTKNGGPSDDVVIGVVVANKDLPPGQELKADDLTVSRLPADKMPSGSFRTVEELMGRTTLQPLVKGQTLFDPLLAPTGAKGGLMGLIPTGQRAMTIEINEFSGLAGMLQPGARVDIVASLRDEKGLSAARTILQNLEVRAVGRNINPMPPVEGAPPPPTTNVTLLVTPHQAQVLNLATQNGRPWLVLRNNLDKEMPESELVTLAELTSGQGRMKGSQQTDVPIATTMPATLTMTDIFDKPSPTPSRPAARVVQVIRGGVESSVKFEQEQAERKPAAPATKPAAPASPFGPGRAITDVGSEPLPE